MPSDEAKETMESLQRIRDSLGRLAVKPWRLVGFGYYQAWIYLAVLSTVLFAQSGFFADHLQFTRQYFSLSVAGFLLVLVFVSPKLNILERRRYLLVATAALTALGTVLVALPVGDGAAKLAAVVAGITLTGLGNAFLIVGWGALWSKMDTDRMGLHLVVSNAFAGCLYLVVTQLPAPAAVAVTAALPLCSVLTLLSSEDEPRRAREAPPARPKRLIGKAIAAIAAIPFVFGLARAFSSPADAAAFSDLQYRIVMGMTAFAIAVALLAALAPRQRIVLRLYRFVVPLMAAGFISLPFVPDQLRWVAFAAIMCGFYSFEGLVWLLQPEYAFRTRASTIKVFGWGRCLFHVCGFLGVTAGFACVEGGAAAGSVPVAICLGAVLVLIVLSTFVFTEHDLRRFVEEPARPEAGELLLGGEADGAAAPATADDRADEEDRLFERIARAGGLSRREREVLGFLGRGRSVPFIADALVISKGTVKTHVRHVYEKLDVHSKQELLDLVERERRQG